VNSFTDLIDSIRHFRSAGATSGPTRRRSRPCSVNDASRLFARPHSRTSRTELPAPHFLDRILLRPPVDHATLTTTGVGVRLQSPGFLPGQMTPTSRTLAGVCRITAFRAQPNPEWLGLSLSKGKSAMVPSCLIGRENVVHEAEAYLSTRHSVLLVGPAGSGKTAVIGQIRREGLLVVDPFARITSPRAAALRRALDRGAVVLGAARGLDRKETGHVGRIAWRFDHVYLRPLSSSDILRIVRATLDGQGAANLWPDRHWLSEAIEVAAGLPGRAVALSSVAATRWRERGTLVPPRFALVIAWQDGLGLSSPPAQRP